MKYYAVIDTNVLLSALLSKKADSATVQVLDAVFDEKIIPLYHQDILNEYEDVFYREKFHLKMDDLIFYEVAMEKREDGAYLVTGNQKHYPSQDFIITPADMVKIMNGTCRMEEAEYSEIREKTDWKEI